MPHGLRLSSLKSHTLSPKGYLMPSLNSGHLGSGASWFDFGWCKRQQKKTDHKRPSKILFNYRCGVFKITLFSVSSASPRGEKSVCSQPKRNDFVKALQYKNTDGRWGRKLRPLSLPSSVLFIRRRKSRSYKLSQQIPIKVYLRQNNQVLLYGESLRHLQWSLEFLLLP